MATWYYYDHKGQKLGPVTDGQLKGLAKAGQITPETVLETEEGKTAPARKVKGLTFVATAPPETAPSESAAPSETTPSEHALSKSTIKRTKKKMFFFSFLLFLALLLVGGGWLLVSDWLDGQHPSWLVGQWKFDTGSGGASPVNIELLKDGTGTFGSDRIMWKVEDGRLQFTVIGRTSKWDYERSWTHSTLTLTEGNRRAIYRRE